MAQIRDHSIIIDIIISSKFSIAVLTVRANQNFLGLLQPVVDCASKHLKEVNLFRHKAALWPNPEHFRQGLMFIRSKTLQHCHSTNILLYFIVVFWCVLLLHNFYSLQKFLSPCTLLFYNYALLSCTSAYTSAGWLIDATAQVFQIFASQQGKHGPVS